MTDQPEPVDLSLSEGHTPGPWIWIYPEGYADDFYEGPLPRLESDEGTCVADFGNSTQYYPTGGETPGAADRELIASAPAMRSELVRLRAENAALRYEIRLAASSIETALTQQSCGVGSKLLRKIAVRFRAALSGEVV